MSFSTAPSIDQSDVPPSELSIASNLPLEILLEIYDHLFFFCYQRPEDRNNINKFLLPVLLQTCSLWRAAALAHPRLWSFVDFECVQRPGWLIIHTNWEEISNHFSLSKRMGLDLNIRRDFNPEQIVGSMAQYASAMKDTLQKFHEILLLHLPRVQALRFGQGENDLGPCMGEFGAVYEIIRAVRFNTTSSGLSSPPLPEGVPELLFDLKKFEVAGPISIMRI